MRLKVLPPSLGPNIMTINPAVVNGRGVLKPRLVGNALH